jgi:hypothetical protein
MSQCEYQFVKQFLLDISDVLDIKIHPGSVRSTGAVKGNMISVVLDCPGRELFEDIIPRKEWKDLSNSIRTDDLIIFAMSWKDGEVLSENLRQVSALAQALLHVLLDSSSFNKEESPFFDKFSYKEILSPFSDALRWDVDTEFVPFAKYIIAYPLARSSFAHKKQELPVEPKGFRGSPVFFKGRLKRAIMSRILSDRKGTKHLGNLRFLWNWNNGKRGCIVVPGSFLEATLDKHAASMSTEFVPTDLDGSQYDFGKEDCENLDRYDEEIMMDIHERAVNCSEILVSALVRPGSVLNLSLGECSNKASFERKIKEGGGRDFVRCLSDVGRGHAFQTYLYQMVFHPRRGVLEVRSDYEFNYSVRSLYDLYYGNPIRQIEGSDDLDSFSEHCLKTTNKLHATVATVLEPLKVRVLTKGEAVPQYLAKPLQKFLWRSLVRLNPFRLIGEEVSPEIINEFLDSYDDWEITSCRRKREVDGKVIEDYGYRFDLKEKSFFVSGDYSAATDGLNPWLSQYILRRVLEKLQVPLWYEEMCLRVLGNHQFDYGVDYKKSFRPDVIQRKGQLMGSVLSFPILCLLNMVGYMLLKGVDNKHPDLISEIKGSLPSGGESNHSKSFDVINKLPVLINGDDILFIASEDEYDLWKARILPHLGFTMSIGKNLVSRNFLTINSRMFHIGEGQFLRGPRVGEEESTQPGRWTNYLLFSGEQSVMLEVRKRAKLVPFLNQSLLHGNSKVLGGPKNINKPIWDIHNECKEGVENVHVFNYSYFLYNRESLKSLTSDGKYQLYLPRSLGGCGFKGEPEYTTYYQKCLASYLFRRHKRLSDVVTADMGLVNKTIVCNSTIVDPFKDEKGIRVRNFDVPCEGWRRKPDVKVYKAVNYGDTVEVELERRFPIELPKDTRPVKNIQKLYDFTDDLVIHMPSGHSKSLTQVIEGGERGLDSSEIATYPGDPVGYEPWNGGGDGSQQEPESFNAIEAVGLISVGAGCSVESEHHISRSTIDLGGGFTMVGLAY